MADDLVETIFVKRGEDIAIVCEPHTKTSYSQHAPVFYDSHVLQQLCQLLQSYAMTNERMIIIRFHLETAVLRIPRM